jgi:hypothetical protein
MAEDLERRIDELYGLPLDRFTAERDALARGLAAAGDRDAAGRVRALRKPVVAAWALNRLAREDPDGIGTLRQLGERLRDAQRRALSGADAEPLRQANDERRAAVSRLAERARELLEREGVGGAAFDDVVSTLDAAAVDDGAAEAIAGGRLVRPMRPPTGFGETAALTVLPGGGRGGERPAARDARADDEDRGRARLVRELRRELGAAETARRRAEDTVRRAREQLEDAERRRVAAREKVREAEATLRGAALEAKRVAAALAKLERQS